MSSFQNSINEWIQNPDDIHCQSRLLSNCGHILRGLVNQERDNKGKSASTSLIIQLARKQSYAHLEIFVRSYREPPRETSGGFFERQSEFAFVEAMKTFVAFGFYWALLDVSQGIEARTRIVSLLVVICDQPIHRQLDCPIHRKIVRKFAPDKVDEACLIVLDNKRAMKTTAEQSFDSSTSMVAYVTAAVLNVLIRKSKRKSIVFISDDIWKLVKSLKICSPDQKLDSQHASLWGIPSSDAEERFAERGFLLVLDMSARFRSSEYSLVTVLMILAGLNYRKNKHRVWSDPDLEDHPLYTQPNFVAALKKLSTTSSPRELIRAGLIFNLSTEEQELYAKQVLNTSKQVLAELGNGTLDELDDADAFKLHDPKGKYKYDMLPFLTLLTVSSGLIRAAMRQTLKPSTYTADWPNTTQGTTSALHELSLRIVQGERPTPSDMLSVIKHVTEVYQTVDDWINCLKA